MTDEHSTSAQNKRLKTAFVMMLAVLILVLIFLFYLLDRDYRRGQYMEAAEGAHLSITAERQKGPLKNVDVGDIAGWMTFDYVNYLFELPPTYLKTAVPINDPAYPHLSLNSYAHYTAQSRTAVVTAVQNKVVAYLTASSSTQ